MATTVVDNLFYHNSVQINLSDERSEIHGNEFILFQLIIR